MGQVLHGSARTTEAVRRAIHHSQESLRQLSRRYGIHQKTVAKWKKRTSVADLPTGPREPKSTADDRGGGDCRRLPPAYALAAR
jgi:transposase-like protein